MEEKTFYLIYVVGDVGVGKTTLLAHLATLRMIPPLSISDLLDCKKEIEKLRLGGWDNLSLEPHVKHLVYVVEDTFIAKNMGYLPRYSMELNFEQIGLYDGENEVAYLLPYSTIVMPEIQSKLDSRKSMTAERVADSFLRWLERRRKIQLKVIADSQLDESADKRFRSMADKVIEVQRQEHKKDKFGEITKTTWFCREFDGINAYMRYETSGKLNECTETKYIHDGNIFECVDSFSGKEYFYNGMTGNFHTTLSKPFSNDKQSMLERCRRFPLFKKEVDKIKKEVEKVKKGVEESGSEQNERKYISIE